MYGGWTVSFDVSPCRSLVQRQGRGPFDVPAQSVGNDFNQGDLRWSDLGNLAVVLTHMLADYHAVYAAVLGLHQTVAIAAEIEGADHLQGIERELFQKLAIAVLVGPYAGARYPRSAGHERRAQILIGVGKGLVR